MAGSATVLNLSLESTCENLISRLMLSLIFSFHQVKVKNQHIFIAHLFTDLVVDH